MLGTSPLTTLASGNANISTIISSRLHTRDPKTTQVEIQKLATQFSTTYFSRDVLSSVALDIAEGDNYYKPVTSHSFRNSQGPLTDSVNFMFDSNSQIYTIERNEPLRIVYDSLEEINNPTGFYEQRYQIDGKYNNEFNVVSFTKSELAALIHELAHYVMDKINGGDSLPYPENNSSIKQEYEVAAKKVLSVVAEKLGFSLSEQSMKHNLSKIVRVIQNNTCLELFVANINPAYLF